LTKSNFDLVISSNKTSLHKLAKCDSGSSLYSFSHRAAYNSAYVYLRIATSVLWSMPSLNRMFYLILNFNSNMVI